VPPALLALLEGGLGLMIAVVVVYSVVNFVLQSIVQPKVVGDSVDLSVTVTFLSLVLWAWILGGLGAILAVPLTLLARALLVDASARTRWAGTLLSSH
jgi:predicted PurR-regulated permease PerM